MQIAVQRAFASDGGSGDVFSVDSVSFVFCGGVALGVGESGAFECFDEFGCAFEDGVVDWVVGIGDVLSRGVDGCARGFEAQRSRHVVVGCGDNARFEDGFAEVGLRAWHRRVCFVVGIVGVDGGHGALGCFMPCVDAFECAFVRQFDDVVGRLVRWRFGAIGDRRLDGVGAEVVERNIDARAITEDWNDGNFGNAWNRATVRTHGVVDGARIGAAVADRRARFGVDL